MFVPLSWLREFTPYEGSAQKLGDRLTMLGLELEEIVNPFANIMEIVVGHVALCEAHPDSDHLHCCKVDIGSSEMLDIVCGAPNVATGQKVAVAPVGSTLPDGTKIKKARLRGQPSTGMICSERELGLSEDHKGILVLPESCVVGQKLVDALNLDREVLDISITPNRGDCLSILGMARETATAFKLPLNVPELPLILDSQLPEIVVPLRIDDPDLCWLYSGRVITDMTVAPSPLEFRCRLQSVGIRAVSNIVDVTNYILYEVGQPLHSFDYDKLEDRQIIVRRAKAGERLVTLDGKDRELTKADLCICDANRPVGLAGVMDDENNGISPDSRNVFLESAVFAPATIRKTSRRLGLISEASYRFERGMDQSRTIWAMDRACSLLASICGGKPRKGLTLLETRPFVAARIPFRPKRADAILGVETGEDFDARTLENLGCGVDRHDAASWTVNQPAWRHDLAREADLVEEVGRFYGLDSIPPVIPHTGRVPELENAAASKFRFLQRIKHWGAGLGLNEVINYSFVGHDDLDKLNLPKAGRISILNPLSSEQDVLRTALAPGLLNDLRNNLAQGAQSLKIFETANTFIEDAKSETTARETSFLGLLLYGLREEPCPAHKETDLGYADIKGLVENLLAFLQLPKPVCKLSENSAWLVPGVDILVENECVGTIGLVKQEIAEQYHARKECWLAELNLEILGRLAAGRVARFEKLQIYPPVRRDMTIIASPGIKAEEIFEKISAMKLPLLEGAILLDCFEPEGGETRNLTIRLTFRHSNRTLKDEEVDKEREKVAKSLRTSLGVEI